jgi:hypothetical protein
MNSLARWITTTLLAVVTATAHAALENQVKDSPVPYLAMHGTDAVHWQQWNAATLQRARDEDKPLFISVGFFACYWCHVMQRESFRDPDIGRILNSNFIPVIVDRELEPELDAQLLEFVERYRGSAGWPLNVIVTPEGFPVLGGVYFPRPELRTVLERLGESWDTRRDDLKKLARAAAAVDARSGQSEGKASSGDARMLARAFVESAMGVADRIGGGFGEQSKFPMSAHVLALFELRASQRSDALDEFLRNTLSAMAGLGLRDHLGGGFFRYTTDPAWRTPHFEKMLYDQALIALVFLRGAEAFGAAEYARVARETLDFALERLRDAGGMFVSSLSAVDERGDEGAYYLWERATLNELLTGDELAVVRRYFGLTDAATFEHGDLLIPAATIDAVARALGRDSAKVRAALESAAAKLRAERARRSLPVDTKRIAAWNGLMLAALTEAARLPDGKRYADAARVLRGAIVAGAWRDGTLYRDARDTRGTLEDYAYVADGLVRYARQFTSAADRELAHAIVTQAWARFYRNGVWSFAERSLLPPRAGKAAFDDGVLPSASAVLVRATLELAAQSGDKQLMDRATAAQERSRGLASAEPFNFPTHIAVDQRFGTGR